MNAAKLRELRAHRSPRTHRLTRQASWHIVCSKQTTMDFLLAFNDDAALVGDMNGKVRTERRPEQLTAQAWENRLRFAYIEAERSSEDAGGMRYTNATG